MNYAETLGVKAKAVESAIATAAPQVKNNALAAIADALLSRQEEILAANAKDLEAAVQNHMTASLQDRLRLTPARISGMADAARQLIAAEDPIGSVDSGSVRPNGLQILKTRVPLGVIGIIFESRPNVTVDAATLCLKAGNVVILRGGKEAIHSNTALAEVMRDAVETVGLPRDIIQLVEDTSRETAADMMHPYRIPGCADSPWRRRSDSGGAAPVYRAGHRDWCPETATSTWTAACTAIRIMKWQCASLTMPRPSARPSATPSRD